MAVPPARADGGRVDMGRADVKFLQMKKLQVYYHFSSKTSQSITKSDTKKQKGQNNKTNNEKR